jgi:hypothetical protein
MGVVSMTLIQQGIRKFYAVQETLYGIHSTQFDISNLVIADILEAIFYTALTDLTVNEANPSFEHHESSVGYA